MQLGMEGQTFPTAADALVAVKAHFRPQGYAIVTLRSIYDGAKAAKPKRLRRIQLECDRGKQRRALSVTVSSLLSMQSKSTGITVFAVHPVLRLRMLSWRLRKRLANLLELHSRIRKMVQPQHDR
jgi:hypothetical protein